MARKAFKRIARVAVLLVALAAGYVWWEFRPMPKGEAVLIRFDPAVPLAQALETLQAKGIVRNARFIELYSQFRNSQQTVTRGTYRLKPGMGVNTVLSSLKEPVVVKLLLPPNFWIERTGKLLEKHEITKADDYVGFANTGEQFQKEFSMPLPKDSLEGYLYPSVYPLEPLSPAKEVVEEQLKAFESDVWKALSEPKNLSRALIVASMVELEVKREEEKPIVAGVIENRIARGMPLQIDATVNYGMGVWKPLTRAELKSDSPYNTYLHKGLPPGPICSPSLSSIKAALNPAQHRYLYYVAMPDGHHLFSSDYKVHLHNIALRKAAMKKKS